jgi:cytochrome c553
MKTKFTILFTLAFAALNACVYRKAEPLPPAPITPVDFQAEIKPILVQHCFVCHSASSTNPSRPGYAFLDQDAVLKTYATTPSSVNASYVQLIAFVKGIESPRMPINAPALSDSDIQKLENWVNQGAPIN